MAEESYPLLIGSKHISRYIQAFGLAVSQGVKKFELKARGKAILNLMNLVAYIKRMYPTLKVENFDINSEQHQPEGSTKKYWITQVSVKVSLGG